MTTGIIDTRLPLIQNADVMNKVVLVRVDHNVVKKGKIQDPYRIDATLGTLYNIVERGGRLILMTHVGRPKDKKTGAIKASDESSVKPIKDYLERKLNTKFVIPEFPIDAENGIKEIDTSINWHLRDLRARKIGGIYLPNTRWFAGEEASDIRKQRFAIQLSGLADVYVNDAFGSWQPHASTFDITDYLPSYAGFLMQKELMNLQLVLEPKRPFTAVIAGAKYDTKIGTLSAIYERVDKLILGGVIYNAFLCAKYNIQVAGVSSSDIQAAQALVKQDEAAKKIIELPAVTESDTMEGRIEGKYRTIQTNSFKPGQQYGYFLDVAPESFAAPEAAETIASAKTIFINAVMGFTPHFVEGTSALNQAVDKNKEAKKMFGGGDTLEEFKGLNPGLYFAAIDNPSYYFFTGGGTVLTAIEEGSPYSLKPVAALMAKKKNPPA